MTRINKNHKRNSVVGKKKARKQQKAKHIDTIHKMIVNDILNASRNFRQD